MNQTLTEAFSLALPRIPLAIHIFHSLITSVLGSAFGFYVYGVDFRTARCIFLPSFIYNLFTSVLCLILPFLKIVIIPSMMLVSCCIIRYSIGDHKKYMVDAMIAAVLNDTPSHAITETFVSFVSLIISSISWIAGYFVPILDGFTCEKVQITNLIITSLDCLKTFAILFAILFSGRFVSTHVPDPELARYERPNNPARFGIIDMEQLSRATVAGSYILVEGLFFEGRNISDTLIRLFIFESAYYTYYALRSRNLPGPLTNLISGTIFGYLFQNITTLSDVIAMSITAPSSGIVRAVYLLYSVDIRTQSIGMKNLKRMGLMIAAYGSGVFIARTLVNYLKDYTDHALYPTSFKVAFVLFMIQISTFLFRRIQIPNATFNLRYPPVVGDSRQKIVEARKKRKEQERIEKQKRREKSIQNTAVKKD